MTGALVWLGVGAVGGAGAVGRFLLDRAVTRRLGRSFPAGTFAVNVLGALLLGVLAGADVGGDALLLAGTAALGSFTTFSTWMLESERLGEDGQEVVSALNVAVSLGAGLAAAALGRLAGGAL